MPVIKLIADSGSTKTEWCLLHGKKKTLIYSQGMSPYFLTDKQMADIIKQEVVPHLKKITVEEIFYYGTGCTSPANVKIVRYFPRSNDKN